MSGFDSDRSNSDNQGVSVFGIFGPVYDLHAHERAEEVDTQLDRIWFRHNPQAPYRERPATDNERQAYGLPASVWIRVHPLPNDVFIRERFLPCDCN